jgi:hypothetical protein
LLVKRRDFITLLGGAAAAWPFAARAEQRERMRRIGVLISRAAADVDGQVRIAAFLQGWLDNTPFDEWTEWHPFSRAEVQ